MKKATLKYPNGAILYEKVYFDARRKPFEFLRDMRQGYIKLPQDCGIVEFHARGGFYELRRFEVGWDLKNISTGEIIHEKQD
jgi:hypothetical protein